MDSLREGIGLRAYGQRDPLIEYKREAFGMFSQMIAAIEEDAVQSIFKLQPVKAEKFKRVFSSGAQEFLHPNVDSLPQVPDKVGQDGMPIIPSKVSLAPVQSSAAKAGRNDPCPCGSGKKYKRCCGK
jgi:preprotein translocase subunit SecA